MTSGREVMTWYGEKGESHSCVECGSFDVRKVQLFTSYSWVCAVCDEGASPFHVDKEQAQALEQHGEDTEELSELIQPFIRGL